MKLSINFQNPIESFNLISKNSITRKTIGKILEVLKPKTGYVDSLDGFRGGKMVIGILMFLVSFVISLPTSAGQCPGTNVVEDPLPFEWTPVGKDHYSGVIEVGEATFNINGETLTTRAYRQEGGNYSIPGPTIKVVPGNKYILRFHNTLPYEPLNPKHNIFKDPNASNIHTHGLHISGESPGDDVTRTFEGGHGGDFVWDIPKDHMGGTYWYHAHHHGSTFLQVSGGLFGMLIVDDGGDVIPDPVAAMTEREIVLGFLDPAAAGAGGDQLMSGTLSPTWTVNGLVEGNICIPPNTWQHWRVLVADRAANMKTLEFGPNVDVMLLARDGVWRTIAPKDLTTNTLELSGASRADFAIKASGDSWVSIDGTTVANIWTDGTANYAPHPYGTDGPTWSAKRPNYLWDLRNETNVNFESISMGARTINGSKWDKETPTFRLTNPQVQEWSLSGAVQHPFHLHIYHVQALEDDNGFEAGEYYDVVAAKMSVRFSLNNDSSPYDGRTILHCHILSHEDRGAMTWVDVKVGGTEAPTFPAGFNYSEYYPLGVTQQPPVAPTDLVATAGSSSSINLNWVDNSLDEDGFDIERSTDGTNFSFIGSVDADVTSYTDNGLSASSTYYYRITAFNNAGSSEPTNVASATTLSSNGGVVMHVENISLLRESAGKNRFRAVATITIFDASDSPVSGATVYGLFTGPSTSNVSGITDNNGEVSLISRSKRNPDGLWCFDVTDVTLSGAVYNPPPVTEVCESSSAAKAMPRANMNDLVIYPNPFQNSTQIMLQLQQQSKVSLMVYNSLGERVAAIMDGSCEAGQHFFDWDAQKFNSGIYILQLKAGNLVDTRRLVLTR